MTDTSLILIVCALLIYSVAMALFFARLAFGWDPLQKLATGVTLLGFGLQVASFAARWVEEGHYPLANMYEYSVLVSLVAIGVFLFTLRRPGMAVAGGPVLALAIGWIGVGVVTYVPPGPTLPVLTSYWREVHVTSMASSASILTIGFALTLLQVLRSWADRSSASGGVVRSPASSGIVAPAPSLPALPRRWAEGIMWALPEAPTLERLAYRMVVLGLPIWVFGTIMGALWAQEAWGHYWEWDPKETWALITAVVYSAYWHSRATQAWRGRRSAALMSLGFMCLVVTYYFVNIFIVGRHSYAR